MYCSPNKFFKTVIRFTGPQPEKGGFNIIPLSWFNVVKYFLKREEQNISFYSSSDVVMWKTAVSFSTFQHLIVSHGESPCPILVFESLNRALILLNRD